MAARYPLQAMVTPLQEEDWPGRIAAMLLQRAKDAAAQRAIHKERGRAAALKIAYRLGQFPGVSKVFLFGSLSGGGGLVHAHSDIDLGVLGLRLEDVAAASLVACEESRVPVDLVRLEGAGAGLRARIEEEGEVLFESR